MKNRLLLIFGLLAFGDSAYAQTTISSTPSTEFDRWGLWRALFGKGWRDVWKTPVNVPVLDIGAFAGGLEPYKEGGNQSRTLHFHGKDGKDYIFRSTYKNVENALPKDLKKTLAGEIIQDQTGSFHPTGLLAANVLQDAVGLIHANGTLYYMPDDPRLGKYRERIKNSLGTLEEKPADQKSEKLNLGGAKDIKDTEDMMIELEESTKNKVDARQYLTARLIDFMLGDPDRGADNWSWAEFEENGMNIFRPIPRDRDYAFMRIEGAIPKLASMGYLKLTQFRPEFPKLRTLTFMTAEFDRTHLSELGKAEWDDVVNTVQRQLSNDVIDRAIAEIPKEHQTLSADLIREGLRGRRDLLHVVADRYYQMIAEDADVFASDEDERADITQNNDGSVDVKIYRKENKLVYNRRFVPGETQTVRVFMERGDDQVVVRGSSNETITIRVIGGEGNDKFADASVGGARFYDSSGKNEFIRGAKTVVVDAPYETMQPARFLDREKNETEKDPNPRTLKEERRGRHQDLQNARADFVAQKTTAATVRTWGKLTSIAPVLRYQDGPGIIIGAGPVIRDFGFRRAPYESRLGVQLLKGINHGWGVQVTGDRRYESTNWRLGLFAHATQLASNRFYGYGNDSPLIPEDLSLVMRDEILVQPSFIYQMDKKTSFSFGPVARWTDRTDVGGRAQFSSTYATVGGAVYNDHSEVDARGKLDFDIGASSLGFRASGKKVWGDFPLWDAAFVGGLESLRGYWWNRFAGDASVAASAEARVPLFRIKLLTAGDLGVSAFADAGRVWYKGNSTGELHKGYGGGLWFRSLGQVINVAYARGEEGHLYVSMGFPF